MSGWVAGAVVVGGIADAVIGSNAAKSAANTQAGAAANATNAELSMFNTTQQNLAPYMKAGGNALSALDFGLGIGPKTGGAAGATYGGLTTPFSATQYQQSPGYAWQLGQGIDAVQNSASAAGGIGGGNTLKALTQYGQGLANTDYQQAYQNYVQQQQQTYGMLSGQAAAGQNAAAGLGGISAQVGGQVGGNIIGAGNAIAAGQIGQANAIGGGVDSLAQLGALYGNGSYGTAGTAATQNAIAGINTSPSGYGNVGGYYMNCDAGMKKNIEPYLFDGVAGLQVYEFHYQDEDDRDAKHLGFIAQEAIKRYPNAVKRHPAGHLMINYAKIPTAKDWAELREIELGVFE